MLRIRIILMSFLFLLFVGMNKNVRAAMNSNELVQKSTDKDQSENESQEQESGEIITHLDFFGAFSLVNVQLQWKDFHLGLDKELSEADSDLNPNELFVDQIESLSSDEEQIAPTSQIIIPGDAVLPLSTYRTIDGKAHYSCDQNKQSASTIAYILNCGTYPKSC